MVDINHLTAEEKQYYLKLLNEPILQYEKPKCSLIVLELTVRFFRALTKKISRKTNKNQLKSFGFFAIIILAITKFTMSKPTRYGSSRKIPIMNRRRLLTI